jgi:protein-L-isoaspartate(D-aspartate) O-methyltransferase
MQDQPDDRTARNRMVRHQLEERGISDPDVLAAMRHVPRHLFVPQHHREFSYEDRPLPIGCGQTISQPYIVALMSEALQIASGANILEIGTGCGYAAAVLAELGAQVTSIERIGALSSMARSNLRATGYENVEVQCADGSLGWPGKAPYDGIVVTAGAPVTPESLKRQLKPGGHLVIPVGAGPTSQNLLRITRTGEDTFETEDLGPVFFVPLIGEEGWGADQV